MRIAISAQTREGLRVIPLIEDYQLCWIEGKNGTGKSLAVRLLQLIAGDQPYADHKDSWQSLKSRLGRTTISISRLSGVDSIDVDLDPVSWPDDPTDATERLGSVQIDREPATFADIQQWLSVFRLSGDETISRQFRVRIELDRDEFQRQWTAWETRLDDLGGRAHLLEAQIGTLGTSALHELRERVGELRSRDYAREIELHTYQAAAGLAEERSRLTAVQDRMLTELPQIDAELLTLSDAMAKLRENRDTIEERRLRLLPEADRKRLLLAEQSRLADDRESVAAEAERFEAGASAICRSLSVGPTRDEAVHLEDELRAREQRLLSDRTSLDLLPELTVLVQDLRAPLGGAAGSGVDSEIVAVVGDVERLTAKELREALDRRATELAGEEEARLLGAIEAELADIARTRSQIRRAKSMFTRAHNLGGALAAIEGRLARISKLVSRSGDDEYASLGEQLSAIDERRVELARRQAERRIERRLLEDYGTPDEVAARIESIDTELGELDVPTDVETLRRHRDELRAGLDRTRGDLGRASLELAGLSNDLVRTTEAILNDPRHAWVNAFLRHSIQDAERDPERLAFALDQTNHRLQRLHQADSWLRTEVARVTDALNSLPSSIGAARRPVQTSEYVPRLAEYYESELGELLRKPEVQRALFGSGTFRRLNLLESSIEWAGPDAAIVSKPLDAFSSGERAFTYLLASILQFAGNRTPNRLMVLDEFGAFVDAENRARLVDFLEKRVIDEDIADQVVIILPLRATYGDDRDTAIRDSGYFMTRIGRQDEVAAAS